jgi:hypothetical protein
METLTFRVDSDTASAIRHAAREKRVNLSEYLRTAATPEEKPFEGKFIPERDPITGFWRNAAPNQPQYTHEDYKKFLEDFP